MQNCSWCHPVKGRTAAIAHQATAQYSQACAFFLVQRLRCHDLAVCRQEALPLPGPAVLGELQAGALQPAGVCLCTCLYVFVCVYVRACMRVHACVQVCMHARVCVAGVYELHRVSRLPTNCARVRLAAALLHPPGGPPKCK